jgi:hypothetical protein
LKQEEQRAGEELLPARHFFAWWGPGNATYAFCIISVAFHFEISR